MEKKTTKTRKTIEDWNGVRIGPGESRDLALEVGESYTGSSVKIPIHVRRAEKDGPAVFVTAALHGDELNGTGAIRSLILDASFRPVAGAIVLVPVLNIPGFDRHSRYLPDRRDLNRSFPGAQDGSLARRLAFVIFDEIVSRCDYGIDLHTAAVRRTNFPTLRADLEKPEVKRIAAATGCELIIDGKGPKGSLRRAANDAGCATVALEAGEVWKVEPSIVEYAVQTVRNVLVDLGMLQGPHKGTSRPVIVKKSKWVRAERGGFLQFHAAPGDVVDRGQELATNTSLLGHEQNVLTAPFRGVVIGMTTLPAVSPGEAVFHIAKLGGKSTEIEKLHRGLHERVAEDLATSVLVVEPGEGKDEE